MWMLVMFDLPTKEKEEKQEYQRFRKVLLKEGFIMMQYSVYARFCGSMERSDTFLRRIKRALPPGGQVRVLPVTDCQFGKMEVYYGKTRHPTEKKPEQLSLF